ncbi:MAG: hypothetical protein ACK5CA_14685 [Cyanobacteriota bacterium]|jgi:hypothetical protein
MSGYERVLQLIIYTSLTALVVVFTLCAAYALIRFTLSYTP